MCVSSDSALYLSVPSSKNPYIPNRNRSRAGKTTEVIKKNSLIMQYFWIRPRKRSSRYTLYYGFLTAFVEDKSTKQILYN